MSKNKTGFFMEIFNEILKINNNNIVIIYDINGVVWFALKDIIIALGYTSVENAVTTIKLNKNYQKIYKDIKTPESLGVSHNYVQPTKKFINEDGLYELLTISSKPLAKIFMTKYITEIMPKIRETGKYIVDDKSRIELTKVNKELEQVKLDNKKLLNNQRNVKYPEGNAIYMIKMKENNKKYYKIGYTKNLNKRLKVYNTGYPNKILYDYFVMIPDKNIDKCIKNKMRDKEFIKNKEYYVTNLKQIINFLQQCNDDINKICCGYCLKSCSLNIIITHKCKYKI
jgi:prophage antirepressor-like protein